ncbi:hypothetical protein [Paenibacillus harenae]|uniref:RES domain-containing protein n=1 Tax=Paenibacillus harenae TaxID=306543 RepID=A0ABT9U713_PAEHA|nr:hypothetical protein [Paenibacillus harenae]MDQ0114024.1 RES domain-containing protein [Paenibacillus harenae]
MYFSTGEIIVRAELGAYDIKFMIGRTMFSYEVKLTKMLDLSNQQVRDTLGVSLENLLNHDYRVNIGEAVTHRMGEYAKKYGYNGIIAP